MSWRDQLIGLFVFFTALNTTTIGLRLFTRIKLTKGAFGWDDVVLIFSHVGMVLFIAFSLRSLHYGLFAMGKKPWHDDPKAKTYYFAMGVVCYIISGTVKISVALVLYRLDGRKFIRAIILCDIITCSIWTLFTTITNSLICMSGSPYQGALDGTTCRNVTYAGESLYIIYDVFHVMLPIFILRQVKISKGLKCSVIGLFSLGILAAIAAGMKLKLIREGSHSRDSTSRIARGYQLMIWSAVEHGLSIFASSLLALRPVMRLIPKGWKTLLSTFYGRGSANSSGQSSSWPTSKKPDRSNTTESNELGRIGIHNSVTVSSEYTLDFPIQGPEYHAEVRGSSFESSNRLV